MRDKNISVPLGGERMRRGGAACAWMSTEMKGGCNLAFSFFFCRFVEIASLPQSCRLWNFQAKCDKRCESRADVSLFRRSTVKSKISLLLICATFPPTLFLASSSFIKTPLQALEAYAAKHVLANRIRQKKLRSWKLKREGRRRSIWNQLKKRIHSGSSRAFTTNSKPLCDKHLSDPVWTNERLNCTSLY